MALATSALCAALVLNAGPARAGCDNIPSKIKSVRGARGSSRAPYALPAQNVEVRLNACDSAGPSLGSPGACLDASQVAVSLIFKPLDGAPVNVEVLATDCTPSLHAAVDAWDVLLGPDGDAVCIDDLPILITDTPLDDGSECRLNFPFPDTSQFQPAGSSLANFTLSGPTAMVVTGIADPLPTSVATARCADSLGIDPIACVDELYAPGTCLTGPGDIEPLFPHFLALPIENRFTDVCSTFGDESSSCNDLADPDVRFTLDPEGNIYAPVSWDGVIITDLAPGSDFPPPVLVNFQTTIENSLGSGQAIRLPPSSDPWWQGSYTTLGLPLPPIFDPTYDDADPLTAGFNGSTDAKKTVLRFSRRSRDFRECIDDATGLPPAEPVPCVVEEDCQIGQQTCAGAFCRTADGTLTTTQCNGDPDCAGVAADAQCGPELFDLRYLLSPCGPAILPNANLEASTGGAVPLSGLCQSEDLNCFSRDETIQDTNENADPDGLDPAVLEVQLRRTGATLPTGDVLPDESQATGIAVALIHQSPTRRPAVVADGRCVAAAIAETWEDFSDLNGNGEVGNTILRVFCLDANDQLQELVAEDPPLAIDAAPRIVKTPTGVTLSGRGGEPIAISDGLVYFRVPEAANAQQIDEIISLSPTTDPALSEDGRRVAVVSGSPPQVFLRDRDAGTTSQVSLDTGGGQPNASAGEPDIAASGVAFSSFASDIVSGDSNGKRDVFLSPEDGSATLRVSAGPAIGTSRRPSLDSTGTKVAFETLAALDPSDTDGTWDIYLYDSLGTQDPSDDTVTRVSGDGIARNPALSPDGTQVAYATNANGLFDVFVKDLETGATEHVSVSSSGGGGDFPSNNPAICGDKVVWESAARNLVADDTNLTGDIFVRDLKTGVTERISLTATLEESSLPSSDPVISSDCRFAAFKTSAPLTPDDTDALPDTYVVDLVTRLVRLKSPGDPNADSPSLAGDGRTVAYDAMVGEEGQRAVVVRGPDPTDLAADFDGSGAIGETVLGVLDTSTEVITYVSGSTIHQVAVAGRNAVFTAGPDFTVFLRRHAATVPVVEDLGRSAPSGVAIGDVVCALASDTLAGADVVACRDLDGTGPLVDLEEGGAPIPADSLAVEGSLVTFTSPPDAAGARSLRIAEFDPSSGSFSLLPVIGVGVQQFVVSPALVAWDQCEFLIGADLSGDGDQDECVLHYLIRDDPAGPTVTNSFEPVIPCDSDACDPRTPWRAGETTIRFLTLECEAAFSAEDGSEVCTTAAFNATCDLNGDGDCDDLVVQQLVAITNETTVISEVSAIQETDPLGLPEGTAAGGPEQGAVFFTLAGRCSGDGLQVCNSDAECAANGGSCVDRLTPTVLGLPDDDADGVFDTVDDCITDPNAGDADFDQDGVQDACDAFICGDAIVQPAESCDDGVALNGTELSDCETNCTPQVRIEVEERAGSWSRGKVEVILFGSPLLNLEPIPVGGLPPEMIDVDSLRLRVSEPGQPCAVDGVAVATQELEDENADGILDLEVGFPVSELALATGPNEVCLTGVFAVVVGEFPVTPFEKRGTVELRVSGTSGSKHHKYCGLGFELVFVLAPLLWLRRRVVGRP